MALKLVGRPLNTAPSDKQLAAREAQLIRLGILQKSQSIAALSEIHAMTVGDFRLRYNQYLQDCSLNNKQSTIDAKRDAYEKFLWHLNDKGSETITDKEVREFLTYIKNAHTLPGGRWGRGVPEDPEFARFLLPATARTIQYYFVHLKSFFGWAVEQELVLSNPCQKVTIERPRKPKIEPFTPEQVTSLKSAALRSSRPTRDSAVILFMYDTGLRANEFCNMTLEDLDFKRRGGGTVRVIGKGDKPRTVPFGKTAALALRKHLIQQPPVPGMKIWVSKCGKRVGDSLKPNGLRQLYERLGVSANIRGVRCSPHTMRHTFATNYLRRGGDVVVLQQLLGHEHIETTMIYVKLAENDIEDQHWMYSPADALE